MTDAPAPGPDEARRSRAAVLGGVAGFLVAAPLLVLGGGLPLLDALLLPLLLLVMPALALAQASLMQRLVFDRLAAYWSSIATLWIIGATSWLVGARRGGLEALGLVAIPPLALAAWSAGLAAVGIAVLLAFRAFGRRFAVEESRMLTCLLPRTPRERKVFALLSCAAGLGEEVAYRGYVIPALAGVAGLPASVAVSSLVFGVLHAYQGPIGMVRTALMGFVLAGGFLVSGSLLPAILGHTLIDLIGGLVIADRLVAERSGDAAPATAGAGGLRHEKLAETTDATDE